jgi:hypothetical protein
MKNGQPKHKGEDIMDDDTPITATPIITADADRLLGLADQFLEDWEQNEGAYDPECHERRLEWNAIRPLFLAAPAMLKALDTIAATPLWGEPIADPERRQEFADHGEYDLAEGSFEPSADTESTQLRDAVETAREALKAYRGEQA